MEPNPDHGSLMSEVMAEFDFTEDDLRSNRDGTITDRQREKFRGRGRKGQIVLVVLFVALSVLLTIADLQNASPKYWIGPVLAGGFLFIPTALWWYLNRYPLGHNRVNTTIGPLRVDRKLHRGGATLNQGELQLFIGKGAAAKAIPGDAETLQRQLRVLKPGMQAKLYYNNVFGGLVVHSIEFAESGEESNVQRRSVAMWVLASIVPIALIAAAIYNNTR